MDFGGLVHRFRAREGVARGGVDSKEILQQLTRIVESPVFSRSPRHCGLLQFLVKETAEGRADELKESVIATAVLGRNSSYDPQIDAGVRVEIRRLRSRLESYYASTGVNDPIRIEIPVRSYAAVFSRHSAPAPPVKPRLSRLADRAAMAAMVAATALGLLGVSHGFGPQPLKPAESGDGLARSGVGIALLPLTAAGGTPEQLAAGIANQLRADLSRIPHVRVVGDGIPKGSDLRTLAAEWGARLVLAGSLELDNRSVYVKTHLTDAADGHQLWSASYRGFDASMVRLEAEIARAIATEIHLKFLGQDSVLPERYTEGRQTYRLYTEGLLLNTEHDEATVRAGARKFADALNADSRFAPALAALSDTRLRLFELGAEVPEWDGGAAAAKALELDPQLGEAHLAAASVLALRERNWPEAERHFLQAMHLKPKDPRPRIRYALNVLTPQQRFEEAAEQVARARHLDPLSAQALVGAGMLALYRGDFPLARDRYQEALDVDIDNLWLRGELGAALVELGDFARAEQTLRRGTSCGCSRCLSLIAYMYGRMGNRSKASEILSGLERRHGETTAAYELARAYSGLGDREDAVERYLRLASGQHSVRVVDMGVDPAFRSFRSRPWFRELLAEMKLQASE